MSVAKIQVTVGSVSFSGEGNEDWLEKQMDKVLASIPTLAAADHSVAKNPEEQTTGGGTTEAGTLATFIQKKAAGSNQVRRFLATAAWLHLKGNTRLTTKDVSSAISAANQKKLTNPADCLGQNVGKGHCEKDGGQFYVTPEGLKALA